LPPNALAQSESLASLPDLLSKITQGRPVGVARPSLAGEGREFPMWKPKRVTCAARRLPSAKVRELCLARARRVG
jgi:hypothetical protein